MKDTNGDMVNVVNRDDIIDTLQENQIRLDLNGDNKEDILMRNQKQIRLKYADPGKTTSTSSFTRLYRTPVFDAVDDINDEIDRGGWLRIAGSTFKLWDAEVAPQGFALAGQSFDTITIQWDNNHQDGYIVQVTDNVLNRD